MSDSRQDVSRLFHHFGLDPAEYLSFGSEPRVATALAASVASSSAERAVARVLDPALRAARLRARLLEQVSR
jgi:hypothetical protein